MLHRQQTIKKEVSLSGKGLHTGEEVILTFKPGEANSGIKFCRSDLEGQPIIDADVNNVVDTSRGTTLEQNNAKISTCEHVLAALVGLEIDNIIIDLNNVEVPIMDGSAIDFISALQKAEIVEQNFLREYYDIDKPIIYKEEGRNVELTITPSDEYRIAVMTDYNSSVINTQHASMNHISEFVENFSNCRTFCFLHEIESLYKAGLVRGGDLDNAIVFVEDKISPEKLEELKKIFNKPDIKVDSKGYLNNSELRCKDEPTRHKLLDVIGDLALIGKPIRGNVFAARPGHKANIELAKLIKKEMMKKKKSAPKIDLTKPPLFNSVDIYKALPHQAPFRLVDKIVHLDDKSVIGVKNVTINEPQFTGHFPENPVFPGVLLLETIAQVGGVFALSTVPDPDNYWTYFMGIEKAKFRKMVVPGDTIIIKCDLLRPIRRGLVNMLGTAYVGDTVVCEAEILASITKKQ